MIYTYHGHTYCSYDTHAIRCSNKNQCGVIADYRNGILQLRKPHKCKPNVGFVNGHVATYNILCDAKASQQSTSEIVNQGIENLDDGIHFLKMYVSCDLISISNSKLSNIL